MKRFLLAALIVICSVSIANAQCIDQEDSLEVDFDYCTRFTTGCVTSAYDWAHDSDVNYTAGTRSTEVTRSGSYSLKINHVWQPSKADWRAEYHWWGHAGDAAREFHPGDEYWLSFSVYFPSDWIPSDQNYIIHQLHQDATCRGGGGPPFSIYASSSGTLFYKRANTLVNCPTEDFHYTSPSIGTIVPGQWHDFVIHQVMAYTATGTLEIWLRIGTGSYTQVADSHNVTTMFNQLGGAAYGLYGYQKFGIYTWFWGYYSTDPQGPSTIKLYYDAFKLDYTGDCTYNDMILGKTYYVSNGATGTWAGATNISTPCSYSTANANAAAGDTVIYLDDGGVYTITGNFIDPANSGSFGSPIIFQAEAGATVEVRHTGAGAYLRNRSYITIDGFLMKRTGAGGWVDLRNKDTAYTSHHITIKNCTFRDTSTTQIFGGIWITGGNNNISILDNDINNTYGSNMSPNDVIHVRPAGSSYTIEYIRVEGNTMVGGAHSTLAFHNGDGGTLRYIVVKGNNIRNPNHRAMEVYSDDSYARPYYVLLDNNVFWDSGSICGDDGDLTSCNENVHGSTSDKAMDRWQQPNLQWVAEYGIVRRNRMYNGGTGGPYTFVPTGNYSRYNKFYNNVIYKNGYGSWHNSNTQTGNIFVNNAFVDNDLSAVIVNKQIYFTSETSPCVNEWRYNNFDGSEAITFNDCTSASLTTITEAEAAIPTKFHNNSQLASGLISKATYDFRLEGGSALIDKGDWLTTAVGAGTESYTLVVADAKYFTNGWGMITGDTIQIEGRVATAVISNIIDNTILLTTPLTWQNGEGVSLAYSGTKPDIGAFEYEDRATGAGFMLKGTVVK